MKVDADQSLISLLKLGEPVAVKWWFDHYHRRLTAFIRRKIDNETDVEELAQETFLNCLKQLPLFRGHSSLWTWMCSVAKHEVADHYRKRYAKKALKTLPLGELILGEPITDAHGTAAQVRAVLTQLTRDQAELLQAKYLDKKTVMQIASELGKTIKAVESDLFRARAQFKWLWAAYSS